MDPIIDFTTLIVSLIFLLIAFHMFSKNRLKNLPPGPINLPIVGYAPFVFGKKLENVFLELSKKHGDVVYFRIGAMPVVILNSYETIRESLLLNPDTSAARPGNFNVINFFMKDIGIVAENGKIWQDHRRFMAATLRDLGFGKENLESQIREEALVLVEEIHKFCGQPFDPATLLLRTAANIISALTFGVRYKHSDPEFEDLMRIFVGVKVNLNPFHFLAAFPFLRFIIPDFLSGMATWKAIRDQIHEFTETKIQEHETTGNQLRDYSEMYLKKQKSDEASGIINTSFNRDRLQSNMLTLSLAGTNTTASSMRWILKMLVKYPNIQKKLQEEIDAVIGFERVPTYCDRFNMPYTEAFLLETQRYSSLIPFSLPHASQADTKISGYDIPAGVTILPMFFMVHNDPQIWGDPENFRPERFLDANTSLIKSDFWIPFGMGKRSCLGENLARTEIFIFLTNLLQHFTFFAPSKEDLDTEIIGTILSRELLEFKITAQYRPITT